MGKQLSSFRHQLRAESHNKLEVALSSAPSGVYILHANNGNYGFSQKITIQ